MQTLPMSRNMLDLATSNSFAAHPQREFVPPTPTAEGALLPMGHPLAAFPGRRRGVCKFFNATKGFGFVVDNDPEALGGQEVFCHFSAISGKSGFRSLAEGEEVEYEIVQGPKGFQAKGLSGPGGRPVVGDVKARTMMKPMPYMPFGHLAIPSYLADPYQQQQQYFSAAPYGGQHVVYVPATLHNGALTPQYPGAQPAFSNNGGYRDSPTQAYPPAASHTAQHGADYGPSSYDHEGHASRRRSFGGDLTSTFGNLSLSGAPNNNGEKARHNLGGDPRGENGVPRSTNAFGFAPFSSPPPSNHASLSSNPSGPMPSSASAYQAAGSFPSAGHALYPQHRSSASLSSHYSSGFNSSHGAYGRDSSTSTSASSNGAFGGTSSFVSSVGTIGSGPRSAATSASRSGTPRDDRKPTTVIGPGGQEPLAPFASAGYRD